MPNSVCLIGHAAHMRVYALLLSFAAWALMTAPARADQNTCVWIGDSLDSGVMGGVYADGAVHLLEREYDVRIVNLSSPGSTLGEANALGFNSNWLVQTFDHIAGYFDAMDCIVIAAGTNDSRTSNSAVEASLTRIFDYAARRGKRILMLDLVWNNDRDASTDVVSSLGMTWSRYRDLRRQMCARSRDNVCTFLPRPAGLDRWDPNLFSDNVHLNATGQRARANWIGRGGAAARFWSAR